MCSRLACTQVLERVPYPSIRRLGGWTSGEEICKLPCTRHDFELGFAFKFHGPWMAVRAHDVCKEPAFFESTKRVSGKHTVRCDRRGRACAHVKVGFCGAHQRSTSADHVVVDDNLPPTNLCIQSGHTGRPVVRP